MLTPIALREAFDLDRLSAQYPDLDFATKEGEIRIGRKGKDPAVTIRPHDDEWTCSTEEWHGHYDDPSEAMRIALAIIGGLARTTCEYRGDKLSSTWLEVFDVQSFAAQNVAHHLNPFDLSRMTRVLNSS